jgi:hypothetical protein
MSFKKYHHVERLGHREVNDILEGVCYIDPKLDGTNASIWSGEGGIVEAGSRNRQLTLDNDNAGFLAWASQHEGIQEFCETYPHFRLYGEWLVPHTLRSYRAEAWRRFWVFDVWDETKQALTPAEDIADLFDDLGIDYITPLAKIEFPTEEQLLGIMAQSNTFLINDGAGVGEGIVIKRYDGWRNFQGTQTWAKLVRNEFRESNKRAFGSRVTKGKRMIEAEVVEQYVTDALVKKELAKIVHELADEDPTIHNTEELIARYNEIMVTNRRTVIPRLLGTVFYCLINEEGWSFVKKFKNPTIDFGLLNRLTVQRVKELTPELF